MCIFQQRNWFAETRDVQGEFTSKRYCPFDGKFTFKYKSRAPDSEQECFGFGSVADSCPSGSTMNFRPRNCTTTNYGMLHDFVNFTTYSSLSEFQISTLIALHIGKILTMRLTLYSVTEQGISLILINTNHSTDAVFTNKTKVEKSFLHWVLIQPVLMTSIMPLLVTKLLNWNLLLRNRGLWK